MWKTMGVSVAGVVAITGAFVAWFFSLIDKTTAHNLEATLPQGVSIAFAPEESASAARPSTSNHRRTAAQIQAHTKA